LAEADFVEGKNIAVDYRWAISTLAAAEAAREVSKTVPIVMTGLNDPVAADTGTLR